MNLVVLPGLDGTGVLFDPLLRVLPSDFTPISFHQRARVQNERGDECGQARGVVEV